MTIENKTVLITGGATGIGFALAKQLLKKNNKVIIAGFHSD
ncbi:MAG: SDR family NAD(P)-dependent oxidoreductase [Alphaproteobacteria bacterium]|nr:SDR family NAD(P)-dependent oxidoreductase [Alphaproteobacteria bacterium]